MKTTLRTPKAASRLIQARRRGRNLSIEDNRPESAAQAQLLAAVRSGEPSPLVSLVGQGRAGFSPAMIQKKGVAQLQWVVQRGGGKTKESLMILWPFGTYGLDRLKELWSRKLANRFVGLKLTNALFSDGVITLEFSSELDRDVVDKNIKEIADILSLIIKRLMPAGQLALEGGDLFNFEGDLNRFDISRLENIDLSLLRTTRRAPLALESGGGNSPVAESLSGHSSDKFPLFGSPDVSDNALRLLSVAWEAMEKLPESRMGEKKVIFQKCLKLLKRLGVDSPVEEYNPLVKLNMSGGHISLICPPSYRFLNEFAGHELEANVGDKIKKKEVKKEETGEPVLKVPPATDMLKDKPSDEIVKKTPFLVRCEFKKWIFGNQGKSVVDSGEQYIIKDTIVIAKEWIEEFKKKTKTKVQEEVYNLIRKKLNDKENSGLKRNLCISFKNLDENIKGLTSMVMEKDVVELSEVELEKECDKVLKELAEMIPEDLKKKKAAFKPSKTQPALKFEKEAQIYKVGQGLIAVGTKDDFPGGFFTIGASPCVAIAIKATGEGVFALGHLDSDVNGVKPPFQPANIERIIALIHRLMLEKKGLKDLGKVDVVLTRDEPWNHELYAIYRACIDNYFKNATIRKEDKGEVYVNAGLLQAGEKDIQAFYNRSIKGRSPEDVLKFVKHIFPQDMNEKGEAKKSLDALAADFEGAGVKDEIDNRKKIDIMKIIGMEGKHEKKDKGIGGNG